MSNELNFPLKFKICPSCASTRRVFETILMQEKDSGKAGPNSQTSSRPLMPQAVADPTKPMFSCPILIISYDICADCGMEYCVRVDLTTGTPQMKGFGFRPGDPRLS